MRSDLLAGQSIVILSLSLCTCYVTAANTVRCSVQDTTESPIFINGRRGCTTCSTAGSLVSEYLRIMSKSPNECSLRQNCKVFGFMGEFPQSERHLEIRDSNDDMYFRGASLLSA